MAECDVDEILRTRVIDVNEIKWKPSDKIPLITKEIDNLKAEMRSFLDSSDFDLASVLREGRELTAESKFLIHEMEACKIEIEQETMTEILKSIQNHNKIAKELECVNFTMDIVSNLVQIGKVIKELDVGRDVQKVPNAIDIASDLMILIKKPVEGLRQLQVFESAKNKAYLIYDNVTHGIFKEWDRLVSYVSKPGIKSTVITIKLTLGKNYSTNNIFEALRSCKKFDDKITQFSQFLLKEVLIPIMHNDCVVSAETEELMTVTITYKENYKPPCNQVVANMRLLFNYLGDRLKIKLQSTNQPILAAIGKNIAVEFADILVRDCLIDTVPNNLNGIHAYCKITAEVEDLQRLLYVTKFFYDERFSLLRYIKKIDVLFATKTSQYFLEAARSLMLKDLSVSMSIGIESIPDNPIADEAKCEDESVEQALEVLDQTIPKSLFYFPRCMISKSAQELLDLVYVVMEQGVQCADVVSKKLYNTARLIFELYDAVVPYHHENFLQTIPQYVALFHNNCLYLAHNLQTFGDKWLALMEGRDVDYPISFVDLVPKLRELGFRHLTIHMQQQRKQILDNIRESDLNCIVMRDVLDDNAEAAIRQCLRQLHLLKNVWIGVLPSNVFIRLMATLINLLVEELIHRVCTVEDISMDMAVQLNEIYGLILLKGPQLFPEGTDVDNYVKPWKKFHELVYVLGGSLKDIELRWDDGTGPLAKNFTTEELRTLIKALFQNTQFRANLLSKIK